jgi:hypothetical protein
LKQKRCPHKRAALFLNYGLVREDGVKSIAPAAPERRSENKEGAVSRPEGAETALSGAGCGQKAQKPTKQP